MPLPGGPSDKAGNSYERRWTVFALVDLLIGRAQSLRIEVPGKEGVGAEFRLMVDGTAEWHQAKRQRDKGPWTIASLAAEGVIQTWWPRLKAGDRFVFVSSTGAQELKELAERADSATAWAEFNQEFLAAQEQRARFQRVQRHWSDDAEGEDIFEALRNVGVRLIGEPELSRWIEDRLAAIVTGLPATAAAVLGQFADDSVHVEISAPDVWRYLSNHEITARNLAADAALVQHLSTRVDEHLSRLRSLYIGGHELPRPEIEDALTRIADGEHVLLSGAAGSGKSVVAAGIVKMATARGWPAMVISMDRFPDVESTAGLGSVLGLPDSPVTVLAAVAGGGEALLLIDQLDAVSVVSGRSPERLRIVSDLLLQASAHPRLRVLLACRQFDLDNDRELRAVAGAPGTKIIPIGDLDEQTVTDALEDNGLALEASGPPLQLLRTPLHLAIFVDIALGEQSDVPANSHTLADLYEGFWNSKRTACRRVRGGEDDWLKVIDLLVDEMSDRQTLSLPTAILDLVDQHAAVMASEGVLSATSGTTSFFHETFFDYCFARRFVAGGKRLRDLLVSVEQDLFRRAQVRQLLEYERSTAMSDYLVELDWLLTSSQVRLHIKALVVALLQTIEEPTEDEWRIIRVVALDDDAPLNESLWQVLRGNPAWFPLIQAAGDWERWLVAKTDAEIDRAVWALSGMAGEYPEEVAALLRERVLDDSWNARLRRFVGLSPVHAARALYEVQLDVVASGQYDLDQARDLWVTVRSLAESAPGWASELVGALLARAVMLAEGDGADPFDSFGPLAGRIRSASDVELDQMATNAPGPFVEYLLPSMLTIMECHSRPNWNHGPLLADAVWASPIFGSHAGFKQDLFNAMGLALRALAVSDPGAARGWFDILRASRYESAWILLARGYTGNASEFGCEAADWLKEPGALHLGYTDGSCWTARELVKAISTEGDASVLGGLIDAIVWSAPPYERTYRGLKARGYAELCLLNGIVATRRSGPVERRLAELRRKFQIEDVEPPKGITGGFVPAPIGEERARRMTDDQWLRAMKRYDGSGLDWRDGKMVGDASTQAGVLETLTGEMPERFARLMLQIPIGTPETYLCAVLRGLAGTRLKLDLLVEVVRHAESVGGSEINRWTVRLIQSESAANLPRELIQVVASIAVGDEHPPQSESADSASESPAFDGGSIAFAGLNSTRGAAARAMGLLVGEDPSRLAQLSLAFERVTADPAQEVRAMAVGALALVLPVDEATAVCWFHRAITNAPIDLLGSGEVERFITEATRRGRYSDVADVVDALLDSGADSVRQAGARQLAFASFWDPSLDGLVDDQMEMDEATRAGIVEVFATNVSHSERQDRALEVVSMAFNDGAEHVRSATAQSFRELGDRPLHQYESLLEAFAESASLCEQAGTVFHRLEASRYPLPRVVLRLCERFLQELDASIGDISSGAAGDAMYVARLAIRLHAQFGDAETRGRCLDVIDQLVSQRAYGIDADLSAIER